MNWYQGGIEEAVKVSKQKGAIFVVYVEGKDEQSDQLTQLLNEEQASQQLQSDYFVAIKITSDSVAFQQFQQIYKQVLVPSIFFIGKNGIPLEIITGPIGVSEILEKLKQILSKHGVNITSKEEAAIQSESLIKNEQEEAKKDYDVCENDVCTIKPREIPSSSTEDVITAQTPSNPDNTITAEEKLNKAKDLLNKTREAKRLEEEEKQRQNEIERRKVGQDVQKLKRWQQDNDLKELVEERNKEKKESQAARQRVLDQIAQDKAERAAKFAGTTPSPSIPSTSMATSSPRPLSDSCNARLQFRLPDGSSYTHEFLNTHTLQDVYDYIAKNVKLPFQNYILSTTFPRREFNVEEASKTLLELELTPTAVILILPLHGLVEAHSNSWIFTFIWSFIGPLLNFVGYLKSKILGGQATTSSNSAASTGRDRKRATETAPESSSSIPKKRMGESTVVRRQGNIHTLTDKQDSDDENNTWNGNSTQQM